MNYEITDDQLDQLKYIRDQIDFHLDNIKELCTCERPDINYGFELGKMYSHLRTDLYIPLSDLLADIRYTSLHVDNDPVAGQ